MVKRLRWPSPRVAALVEHVRNGLTGSQIALALDTTRSTVMGKIWRLGLALKPNKFCRKEVVPPVGPSSKPEKLPPSVDLPVGAVTLMELQAHHCRFPIGDPKHPDFRFCGNPKVELLPYCAMHARICYNRREA